MNASLSVPRLPWPQQAQAVFTAVFLVLMAVAVVVELAATGANALTGIVWNQPWAQKVASVFNNITSYSVVALVTAIAFSFVNRAVRRHYWANLLAAVGWGGLALVFHLAYALGAFNALVAAPQWGHQLDYPPTLSLGFLGITALSLALVVIGTPCVKR